MVRMGLLKRKWSLSISREEPEDRQDKQIAEKEIQINQIAVTMEENKNKKLSYDELSKAASDLHVQYQKLVVEYQKAMEALRNRDFDYTSFFLSMLFKVMEHPEMYNDKFVSWCSENIEGALTSFAENTKPKEEEKTDGDEAE